MKHGIMIPAAALILGAALFAGGCSDEGDGNGSCPDISGTWTIQDHCEPSIEGLQVTITQSGCSITADWGGPEPWHGTVAEQGGTVSMSGAINGGTTLTCSGSISSNTITMDCTPGDCHIVVTR